MTEEGAGTRRPPLCLTRTMQSESGKETIRRLKRIPVFKPGARLGSDLTVLEHLGGSRKVDLYRCRSESRGMSVACKVLRPEYCVDFRSLNDLREEGELLMELHHPNLIEGYDVVLDKHPRIVMRYLEGQTLATTMLSGNHAAFRVGDFVKVGVDIAGALSYLHGLDLLHLDVKPSNVMWHASRSTLFDLSVAQRFDPAHRLRSNAGTWQYQAPEQARRESLSYSTDVFGLGVVIYQLLTNGTLPFAIEDDEGNGKRRLRYEAAPPPSSVNRQVPPGLDAAVMHAIALDPADRFSTPAAFGDALAELLPQ